MPLNKINLEPNQVHLWFAFDEEIKAPQLLSAYHRLMNETEAEKQRRFHFERHRHQYLLTRALCRSVLSRYADVPPEAWCFSTNDYGRPEIVRTAGVPDLRFNISHTDGVIVMAVMLNLDMGVDIENLTRQGEMVAIADRFFAPAEVKDLVSQPKDTQEDYFFNFWTLKESYIKARGMGLSLPLDKFAFTIGQPLSIWTDESINDNADEWQFWLFRPTKTHKAALAVRKSPAHRFDVTIRKVVPLLSDEPLNVDYMYTPDGVN